MAAEGEHKVRGGSALSFALNKISPGLKSFQGRPSDSASSDLTTSSDALVWPNASAAAAVAAAGGAPSHRAVNVSSGGPEPPAPSPFLNVQRQRRSKLPFLSCFGFSGSFHDDSSLQVQGVVSASEVGIRPCFYWLEAPAMSEEDRMFAEANARWLKSDCQDDAVVIEHFGGLQHQTFAGVFDGHGPYGRNAAKFASTRLPQVLASKLAAGGSSERKRLKALRESCLEVNAAMSDMNEAGFDASLSGTTACCALVVGRKVLVASTGDSRCVVARRSADGGRVEVVPLSWDAKPSVAEEQRRIASSGGVVKQLLDEHGERVGAYRVFSRGDDVLPGLAMSRSLGDLYAHAVGVSPEPVLNTYTLGERDLFLILATDGLWDIMGNEEAADFVERYKAARDLHVSCAEALTLEAQERWKALHEEAIVDDISCVILHTSVLPPPEREASVPRPLARAAACNDEANELYLQWRLEKERNPSNHKPKQYFKHLYGEDGGEGQAEEGLEEGSSEAAQAAASREALAAAAVITNTAIGGGRKSGDITTTAAHRGSEEAGGCTGSGTPPAEDALAAPTSPYQRYNDSLAGSVPQQEEGPASMLASPAATPTAAAAAGGPASPPPLPPPSMGRSLLEKRDSGGALHRMDDLSSSPRSSDYLASDASEPSVRRGSAFHGSSFEGAFYQGGGGGGGGSSRHPSLDLPIPLARRSGSQPIPMGQRRGVCEGTHSMSLPIDSLLRPVRKAYPSTSLLNSYRSDASMAGDTPRSGDDSMTTLQMMEKKVRGGLPRASSVPRFPASMSLSHSFNRPSTDCLLSGAAGGSSRRGSHADDRMLGSSSNPSSPSGDSMLSSAVLSPQLSPVVVPLGGYSRVQASAVMQHGVGPGGLSVTHLVQQGSHLSRTTTDSTSLVSAMAAMAAESGRQQRSCAAAAAASTHSRVSSSAPSARH